VCGSVPIPARRRKRRGGFRFVGGPFGPPGSRFARPSHERSLRSQTRFAPGLNRALPHTRCGLDVLSVARADALHSRVEQTEPHTQVRSSQMLGLVGVRGIQEAPGCAVPNPPHWFRAGPPKWAEPSQLVPHLTATPGQNPTTLTTSEDAHDVESRSVTPSSCARARSVDPRASDARQLP
jgi:hypothetical protein